MAVPTHCSCIWMFLAGMCVSLVAGTDCRKECALCVYHLLGQQSTISSLTCSLECEGELDSQKLHLCQDFILEKAKNAPLNAESAHELEQEAEGTMRADDMGTTLPGHQLAKKYGGFMKRYGGFMSRRDMPEGALEHPLNPDEEETIRLDILKILNAAAGHDSEGAGKAGEEVKRYGGFMRRAEEGVAQGDLLEAVLGRGLKKRYGGFMRRVGRPEWLVDSNKRGGELKRAWENGNDLQKRYGGFMD
ncbi:proenkephalin-A [Takifugu rubripes]|nr:proenkephalin-A [Takifugu rubripes]XP_056913548.1 proenkephalin-A-like [Takifugu flavidus]TWW73414.1 Proenkephalin-A Proenkephalin [Takifugu flavidus]|eukprot:XP_011614671.1 PREDICTED: proenkephalin-A [Takifugu rubripes]